MYRILLTAALVAALLSIAGIWLDGRLRESQRQEQADFELRLEQELDKLISLEEIAGSDRKILDVFQHVAGQLDVPVVLNRSAFEDETLLGKDVCHIPPRSIRFRSLLGMLSRQIPLGYYVEGRRLVITSRDNAEARVVTRVYPLPPLAGPDQPFGADVDTWMEVLSVVVAPDSWDDVGGPAEMVPVPGALVIRQTQQAHDRLRKFFRRLENDSAIPDAQADYLASFSPAEQRIHSALKRPCDFHCTGVPLAHVLEGLSRQHGIPIVLNRPKLLEEEVDFQKPLSLSMKGASLHAVIRSVLEKQGLTFVISDDVLLVTVPNDTSLDERAVVYDVRDLVLTKEGADYDSLLELISTMVDPDGWDDVAGPGPFHELPDGWLACREIGQIHQGTADLLTRLRAALRQRATGISAEVQQTPAEREITAAMQREITLNYRALPLREAVADLARRIGVNIRLDETLASATLLLHADTPVTCELPPLPCRVALDKLLDCNALGPYELDWCIRDESLVLTTKVAANYPHELRIIDASGLVGPEEDENSLGDLDLAGLIEAIARPRDWDGAARVATFRSLVVCSAPRRVNHMVQQLVDSLKRFRDESLAARGPGKFDDSVRTVFFSEHSASRDALLARIYPVADLLGTDGLAAIEDLQNAIRRIVVLETWSDIGGPGQMVAIPPAGLLVSQTQKGHDNFQRFLDELRMYFVPERPIPPWLVTRDRRRQELEQALASRESVLSGVKRMKELRTAVERAIKMDVALGPLYLFREFEKLPVGSAAPPVGRLPPTVKEQLAGLGLAVVDTEHGLKLLEVHDDERLAFLDATELLSRQRHFDKEELCFLLDSPLDPFIPTSIQTSSPVCFRGWLIVRSYEQRLAQREAMISWLKQHADAPRAVEVCKRKNSQETEQLVRQLLGSKSAGESQYLAFVLQFTVPPENGWEELAARVDVLRSQKELLLATRLQEVINRWASTFPDRQLEEVFVKSTSPTLRKGAMQAIISRLLDPFGDYPGRKPEDLIAARKDLPSEEIAELRAAITRREPLQIHRTDFEERMRSGMPLLPREINTSRPPWRKLQGKARASFDGDPFR